jgi:hypothetical protein
VFGKAGENFQNHLETCKYANWMSFKNEKKERKAHIWKHMIRTNVEKTERSE